MGSEQRRGVLFVYSGPSGVGKGTLNAMLFEEFGDRLAFSVSATTRKARPGEIDGKDYFFISRQEFEEKIANNYFLEYAEYAGNLYGTPRPYVDKLLDSGKNVLLEIEVKGALQVMERMPDCVSIFVLPPDLDELERRLRGRGTETEEKICQRLETARRELPVAQRYDHRIVNSEVAAAYAKLREIFLSATGAEESAKA